MTSQTVLLIGAPVDCGKARNGCLMGPDAYRTARLGGALTDLGHTVRDLGNVWPDTTDVAEDAHLVALPETVGWTRALSRAAEEALGQGTAIFMGGDHALSLGSVAGMAAHAEELGRPLFVLWLDAHSDFHTPDSTTTGNLHGTPLGYVTGREGFDAFPALPATVPVSQVGMIGLRSVDPEERAAVERRGALVVVDRVLASGVNVPPEALKRVAVAQHSTAARLEAEVCRLDGATHAVRLVVAQPRARRGTAPVQ